MGNSQRINKYIIKPVSGSKVHISLPYDSHEQMNYLSIQVPKGIKYRDCSELEIPTYDVTLKNVDQSQGTFILISYSHVKVYDA